MSTTNNELYKINQRQGWNGVADEWLKWWDVIEPASKNISLRMMELANIKEGSKVLDVATGVGEPSITPAYQVGKSGHVLATDISLNMLSIAKQRSIARGLDDRMDFKEGDAETIVLPPLSFDAALCRFGLMFLPDIKAGLNNIYKSLVDEGLFSAAVWSTPSKVPFITLTLDTIIKETKISPPPSNSPGPFSLADENLLKESFLESGFKGVTIEKIDMILTLDSANTFTRFAYETAEPVKEALSSQTPERKLEILRAITESVNRYVDRSSGSISLRNEALCIVGKK